MDGSPSLGSKADIRRWAENRRIANATKVKELVTTWGTPEQSIAAAFELAYLYESLHGWPPPIDPNDEREDAEVRERFARLRRPYVR